MRKNKLTVLSLSLLCSVSLATYANAAEKVILVAPVCLLNKLDKQTQFNVIESNKSLALIETHEAALNQFIKAKHERSTKLCGGFLDVTGDWDSKNTSVHYAKTFLEKYGHEQPSSPLKTFSPQYPVQVNSLLKQLNPALMWQDLTAFSNTAKDQFPDRYPNSAFGVKAANWLKSKIETMATENHRTDITTWFVPTGTRYKQPSLIVKVGNSNKPGIVIGGHMDTLSSSWSVKPGADDDGSGSMTVMGIARTLINSGMQFKKPIYFIWYAAEEAGLVGSSYVVKDFVQKKIPVDAVIQFDMTGYAYQNDRSLWLITDHVDNNLTATLETLINTYVKQPVKRSKCGYACSDHASWSNAGFKSSFPFEAEMGHDDPYIHTSQDTMDPLSLDHMTDYAKLGIAFATELAEPLA